jgi:hypothetical protein
MFWSFGILFPFWYVETKKDLAGATFRTLSSRTQLVTLLLCMYVDLAAYVYFLATYKQLRPPALEKR